MNAGTLKELLATVDALPGKQARATLVTRLKVFDQKLGTAESALAEARMNEGFVLAVFPDEFSGAEVPRVEESSTRAAKDARRLRKKLHEKIEFIADTKADELLTKIVESASAARDAVAGQWKKTVSNRVEALTPIVKIAKDARLSGADGIATRLQALEKCPVPSSNDVAEHTRAEFVSIAADVTKIAPGGPAWEFLAKAIAGQAGARDLETPAVRSFLDENKLWDRLTVKLG